jgi:hypothetical protein
MLHSSNKYIYRNTYYYSSTLHYDCLVYAAALYCDCFLIVRRGAGRIQRLEDIFFKAPTKDRVPSYDKCWEDDDSFDDGLKFKSVVSWTNGHDVCIKYIEEDIIGQSVCESEHESSSITSSCKVASSLLSNRARFVI